MKAFNKGGGPKFRKSNHLFRMLILRYTYLFDGQADSAHGQELQIRWNSSDPQRPMVPLESHSGFCSLGCAAPPALPLLGQDLFLFKYLQQLSTFYFILF